LKLAHIIGLIGIGLTTVGISQAIYIYFKNKKRETNLLSAFSQGAVPMGNMDDFIERPSIAKEIASMLQPPTNYDRYDLIVGCQDTGKTTLVRNSSHKFHGIIYVDIGLGTGDTTDEAFAQIFAKALRWSPHRSSWMWDILNFQGLTAPKLQTSKFSQI